MHFESNTLRKVPGILHGFGTKSDPVPQPLLKIWVPNRPTWNQVHGTEISEVMKLQQVCGDVDGLVTRTKHPIAVVTADCVPLLFAKKDGTAVAALHSGWRGTKARYAEKFAKKLALMGESTADWVAVVGPAIGKCCYEVSEELIADFAKTFPEIEHDILSPAFRKLDLQAINALELERLGFSEVDLIDECTYCAHTNQGAPTFHSFRREGGGTRQWSVITRV